MITLTVQYDDRIIQVAFVDFTNAVNTCAMYLEQQQVCAAQITITKQNAPLEDKNDNTNNTL